MKPSKNCLDIIKKWEGLFLKAYKCPAGVWTIGYGSTRYKDGSKIKDGDVVTKAEAEELLMHEVTMICNRLPNLAINQNQMDAICSFIYNVGIGAFIRSTLYSLMRKNPNDPKIGDEFLKWKKAGGKVLRGLLNRRIDEKTLYFK